MGMLGLHIALNDSELEQLQAVPDSEKSSFIAENFEVEKFDSPDCCETDRAWAYIHSAFNQTDPDGPLKIGQPPKVNFLARLLGAKSVSENYAKFAFLGQEAILNTDDNYIGLVEKNGVERIASALEATSNENLGDLVRQAHRKFSASGSADDAEEYAMSWYPALVEFYRHAANADKNIIFTVSF